MNSLMLLVLLWNCLPADAGLEFLPSRGRWSFKLTILYFDFLVLFHVMYPASALYFWLHVLLTIVVVRAPLWLDGSINNTLIPSVCKICINRTLDNTSRRVHRWDSKWCGRRPGVRTIIDHVVYQARPFLSLTGSRPISLTHWKLGAGCRSTPNSSKR